MHSTHIWTQKVSDWWNERRHAESEQVQLEAELRNNVHLASEVIKCTLAQVNASDWTVQTWKEKLQKQGKSFDMTLKVTLNYIVRVLEAKQCSVALAWQLLSRHKVYWDRYNSHMNPQYNGRTYFYFDLAAALQETVQQEPSPPYPLDVYLHQLYCLQ
jgi:hypothetical protein